MSSILVGPLDALIPLANNIWSAELFSELEIIRLGTIITILSLFSFGPSIAYYSEKIDTLIPVGKNRSMSLAISILTGFCCLIFFSIGFLYPEWSIVSIFYELINELFPILFFALIFSLLPIIGLDERARPELHGWRYGLFVGMALSCINSALISLTLLHGWILALFFSLTLPIIIESSIMLNSKIKFVNIVTSIFCLLFIILLMIFSPYLNVVLPTIGLCCIILMEVNDIQLSKVNQLLKT